ncbi:MAG: DegV family protein [Patescibacteria group bacterium]
MQKIGLIIGESADVPKEIIERNQIIVIPYIIDWEDSDKIPGDNVYQKMRNREEADVKTFPKTSQPSPFTFKKNFEEGLQKFDNILCITLSSGVSGGYNSAMQARSLMNEEKQKRIFIIDSRNVTASEGLLVLKAVDLMKGDYEIKEIVEKINEYIPRTHLFGMLEDPKWLEAGGRMSHTLGNIIRQMAKIGLRPLLGLKDGVVTSVALKMRAKDRPTALLRELDKETEEMRKTGKEIKVAITHADNLEEAERLKKMIEKEIEKTEVVFLRPISNVIGVHVGPGSLICSWRES